MKYKIVADSSTDITEEMLERMNIQLAPLTLEVDGVRYVDDGTMDIHEYLVRANSSQNVPKSSCPSPEDYLEAYRGDEEGVFVVTLSSELSGSFSAAILAKNLMEEENSEKKIHVFDSRSASAGQVAITLKIEECINAGMEFEDIVETVEAYRKQMATVFVLEKIDHLQKNGRMSKMQVTIANVLSVKLVLKANDEGEIVLQTKARGTKKAIDKMISVFPEVGSVTSDKYIVVAHVEAEQRALDIKDKIEKLYDFKEVIVVPTRGLSSNYANVGGIVISF